MRQSRTTSDENRKLCYAITATTRKEIVESRGVMNSSRSWIRVPRRTTVCGGRRVKHAGQIVSKNRYAYVVAGDKDDVGCDVYPLCRHGCA